MRRKSDRLKIIKENELFTSRTGVPGMNEGLTVALRRRNRDIGSRAEKAANSVENPAGIEPFASSDCSQALLIIERLRHNNLALERLLSGLDSDFSAPARRSHNRANSFGRG